MRIEALAPEEFKRPTDFRVDVQKGIHARARTGGTIALAESDEYPVEGTMPDGEAYTATVRVTRPHTLVMLKLLALVDRYHNISGRRRRGTIRDRDFASVDPRSEFRFAARAVPVVGVAFVVEFLQTRSRSVVASDRLSTGDLEELSQGIAGLGGAGGSQQIDLLQRGKLQEFLAVGLERARVQRGESGTGYGLRIGGFEIAHRFFSVDGHGEQAVQWVEVLRGGPNSRGRIHPMVEPLRSLRQCRGLRVAQQDLDESGDDAEFLRREELRLKRERVGLDVIRLTARWRGPLLAAAAQRVNQMFGRSVVEAGRQSRSGWWCGLACSQQCRRGFWNESAHASENDHFAEPQQPQAAGRVVGL